MLIKTILNQVEKCKSFVYENTFWQTMKGEQSLIIQIVARKNSQGKCACCGVLCGTYDTQPMRDYEYGVSKFIFDMRQDELVVSCMAYTLSVFHGRKGKST